MIVTYVEQNIEGRNSGMIISDEAATIFRNGFDPKQINKGVNSEHHLNTDFLITLYDGSRMSNNTMEGFRAGRDNDVEKNGLTCLLACQTSSVLACVSQNSDESGVYPRIIFLFADKREFSAKAPHY